MVGFLVNFVQLTAAVDAAVAAAILDLARRTALFSISILLLRFCFVMFLIFFSEILLAVITLKNKKNP